MALASFCRFEEFAFKQNWQDISAPSASSDVANVADIDHFQLPTDANPKAFVERYFGNEARDTAGPCNLHFLKGTTTLAFIYEPKTSADKGGIVVAADSRASSGKYISTENVMKILEINDYIVATMAGGAADCQFWTRVLAKQAKLYELQNKERISVAAASKLLANMLYNYKGMGLSMGTMVAGYDKRGPALYFVDNEGTRLKGRVFSCGSGSLNAYGVLDSFYQEKMTDKEAIDLGRKAIMHATHRDTGSGGNSNLYHITVLGHRYDGKQDVSESYHKFVEEINRNQFDPKDLS